MMKGILSAAAGLALAWAAGAETVVGARWGNAGSATEPGVATKTDNGNYGSFTLNFSATDSLSHREIGAKGTVRITNMRFFKRSNGVLPTTVTLSQEGAESVVSASVTAATEANSARVYGPDWPTVANNYYSSGGAYDVAFTSNTVFDTSKPLTFTFNADAGLFVIEPGNSVMNNSGWSPAVMVTGDYTPAPKRSVSVNFNSAQGAVGTAEYGIWPSTNWLDTAASSGTDVAVPVAHDTAQAKVTWSCKNLYQYAEGITDNALKGYLDDGLDDSNRISIRVTDIPFTYYDVIVYQASDTANRAFYPPEVNGHWYSYDGSKMSDVEHDDALRYGQTRHPVAVVGTNVVYLKKSFSGDLTVRGSLPDGQARGCIAAIQIVETDAAPSFAAAVSSDTTWDDLAWTPAKPESGFPDNAQLTLNVTGTPTLTFASPVSADVSLTVVGAPVLKAADALFADGCYELAVATFSRFDKGGATAAAALPAGFAGAYALSDTGLKVRAQNKAVISVNFADQEHSVGGTGYTGLAPVQGNTWVNATNRWSGGRQTKDMPALKATTNGVDTADLPGLSGTYAANNTHRWTTATDAFLRGYLDDGGEHAYVTVSGIPYAKYDVIVYCATDTGDRKFAAVTVNGQEYTYDAAAPDAAKAGADGWGRSQNKTAAYGVNALRIRSQTSSSLTIAGGANANSCRGCIAAFQIVEIESGAQGKDFTATIGESQTFGSIPWKEGAFIESSLSTATVTVSGEASAGEVTLTLDKPTLRLGQLTVVSAGRDVRLAASEAPSNIGRIDVSQCAGKVTYAWPATALASGEANVAYAGGGGSAASPLAVAHNGGHLDLEGGTFYLRQSCSGTATAVNVTNDARLVYGDIFGIGTATYALGGTASVTTPRLVLSQEANGRAAALTLGGQSSVTVTGTANGDSNQSSVMFGHWNGPSTFTLSDAATFAAAGADVLVGLTRNNHTLNINGGTFTARGIKASANATGTNVLNLSGGTLVLGETGIASYGTTAIDVQVKGDAGIVSSAAMAITQPLTVAEGRTLTLDATAGDISLSGALANAGTIAVTGGTVVIMNGAQAGRVSKSGTGKVIYGFTVGINDLGRFPLPQGVAATEVRLYDRAGQSIEFTEESGVLVYEWKYTDGACWMDYGFNGSLSSTGSDKTAFSGEGTQPYYKAEGGTETNRLWVGHATPYRGGVAYPEAFTAVLYGKMVQVENQVYVGFGSVSAAGSGADAAYSLCLACGAPGSSEVVLYFSSGYAKTELARMTVPNAYACDHLYAVGFSLTDAGVTRASVYLDGMLHTQYTFDKRIVLGTGLQVGSVHGGVPTGLGKATTNTQNDDATIDFLRVYREVLTPETLAEYARRHPYVSPNGSFLRSLAADGSWRAAGTWKNEQTSEMVAAPDANATVKVAVTGARTLSVNLSEDVPYESLRVSGGTSLSLARDGGTDGRVVVTGGATFETSATLAYDAVDVSGVPVSVAAGKTLTFDLTSLDLKAEYVTRTFFLTGPVTAADPAAQLKVTVPAVVGRAVTAAVDPQTGRYQATVTVDDLVAEVPVGANFSTLVWKMGTTVVAPDWKTANKARMIAAEGATLNFDLASFTNAVRFTVEGSMAITNSANVTLNATLVTTGEGSIIINVAEGQTQAGPMPCAVEGRVRKTGKGTLDVSSGARTFIVDEGTFKNTVNGSSVTVNADGTFDVAGRTDRGWAVVLNGGRMVNTGNGIGSGSMQFASIAQTAPSTIGGTGDFGYVRSQWNPGTLDLGGFKLTKADNNLFYLCNTTVTNGTLTVSEGTLGVLERASAFTPDAALRLGEAGTLALNGQRLTAPDLAAEEGSKVTGQAAAVLATAGLPTLYGLDDAGAWKGTVELSGDGEKTRRATFDLGTLGNADTTVRFAGFAGVFGGVESAATPKLGTVEIAAGGLTLDGEAAGSLYLSAARVTGSGGITNALAGAESTDFWVIGDAAAFAGDVVCAAGATGRVIFAPSKDAVLPAERMDSQIVVAEGSSVVVAADRRWQSAGGFCLMAGGTLSVDGTTSGEVAGAGEYVLRKTGTCADAGNSFTLDGWQGTVTLDERTFENPPLNTFGHSGSHLKLRGCAGYLNPGTYAVPLVLEDKEVGGEAYALKVTNGSSLDADGVTFGRVSGSGRLWLNWGGKAIYYLGDVTDFAGSVTLDGKCRLAVGGGALTGTAQAKEGTLYVCGAATVAEGRTWLAKTVLVDTNGVLAVNGALSGGFETYTNATLKTVITGVSSATLASGLVIDNPSIQPTDDIVTTTGATPAVAEGAKATLNGTEYFMVVNGSRVQLSQGGYAAEVAFTEVAPGTNFTQAVVRGTAFVNFGVSGQASALLRVTAYDVENRIVGAQEMSVTASGTHAFALPFEGLKAGAEYAYRGEIVIGGAVAHSARTWAAQAAASAAWIDETAATFDGSAAGTGEWSYPTGAARREGDDIVVGTAEDAWVLFASTNRSAQVMNGEVRTYRLKLKASAYGFTWKLANVSEGTADVVSFAVLEKAGEGTGVFAVKAADALDWTYTDTPAALDAVYELEVSVDHRNGGVALRIVPAKGGMESVWSAVVSDVPSAGTAHWAFSGSGAVSALQGRLADANLAVDGNGTEYATFARAVESVTGTQNVLSPLWSATYRPDESALEEQSFGVRDPDRRFALLPAKGYTVTERTEGDVTWYAIAKGQLWTAFADEAGVEEVEKANYRVLTAEGLAWLVAQLNEDPTKTGYTITLAADLDLAAHTWDPFVRLVGATLDGNGHTVSNLHNAKLPQGVSVQTPQGESVRAFGLAAYAEDLEVRDLAFAQVSVTGEVDVAGALAGYVCGAARVERVLVGSGALESEAAGCRVAGAVGWADEVETFSLTACTNRASVAGVASVGPSFVAGLATLGGGETVTVKDNLNEGALAVTLDASGAGGNVAEVACGTRAAATFGTVSATGNAGGGDLSGVALLDEDIAVDAWPVVNLAWCVVRQDDRLFRRFIEADGRTQGLLDGAYGTALMTGAFFANGAENEAGAVSDRVAAAQAGGTVALDRNVTLWEPIVLDRDITLDLDGHIIDVSFETVAFVVADGVGVTLKNGTVYVWQSADNLYQLGKGVRVKEENLAVTAWPENYWDKEAYAVKVNGLSPSSAAEFVSSLRSGAEIVLEAGSEVTVEPATRTVKLQGQALKTLSACYDVWQSAPGVYVVDLNRETATPTADLSLSGTSGRVGVASAFADLEYALESVTSLGAAWESSSGWRHVDKDGDAIEFELPKATSNARFFRIQARERQ